MLRADTWAQEENARNLIGYFPPDELRLAAETVWDEYQAALISEGKVSTMANQPSGGVEWHPLLNAEERTPGTWTMLDSDGYAYGGVRIVRQGSDVFYLGQFRGNPIGRFDRLRPAVENVHLAYVRATQHPRDTSLRSPAPHASH